MDLWLRFKGWIIAVGAGIAAMIGVYLYGRSSGSLREMQRQAEADRDKAREIENAADRARRADGDNVDPVDRLRKHKRLRDL
jgi:hypothetical protein